jgi:DNA-binding LytR/AlgR family response regulator
MRIAICEDVEKDADDLYEKLMRYFSSSVSIDIFSNGMTFIVACEKTPGYDIVFLDVYMPGMNGMDVAHAIRKNDDKAIIIFVTRTQEYAVEGYWVNAYCYLVKPVVYAQLVAVLDKVMKKKKNTSNLILETDGNTYNVAVNKIIYIEKRDKKTYFCMENGDVVPSRLLIREIMDCFSSTGLFISPFQSFVVNMNHIVSISRNAKAITLSNGVEIPIARERIKDVYTTYIHYIGERHE